MKARVTLGTMMALIVLAALAFAALRTRTQGSLMVTKTVTTIAFLVALIAARVQRERKSAFAFGFAVFGLAYILCAEVWKWEPNEISGHAVMVPSGLPTVKLIIKIADQLNVDRVDPNKPPLSIAERRAESVLAIDRYLVTVGTLHLLFAWAFAAIGGLIGFAFASLRDRHKKGDV